MVEKHKELAAEALTWVRMDRKLLSMTESVDYDVEGSCLLLGVAGCG